MTRILKNNFTPVLIAGLILALGVFVAITIYAQTDATTSTTQTNETGINISFPIPELGNCTSKNACKKYCDDPANAAACIAFAKSHGLVNDEEAEQSMNFAQAIRGGAGPGGCTTPDACKKFCSSLDNLQACLDFAKSHNIQNNDTNQAQKVRDFIASGGQTPGGCTNKESCAKYCSDFSHTEECLAFAKAAGITQQQGNPRNNGHILTADQLQKLSELAKAGETPGGCTSKDTCEAYCKDKTHKEECVAFGTKVGFITEEQGQKIKLSRGAGPGDCTTPDACRTYCSESANQAECFKFGKEHGFISEDEEDRIKEGQARIKIGLDQAPPEVKSCIESLIGAATIQDIESGAILPVSGVTNQLKDCFSKFGQSIRSSNTLLRNAPSQILNCVREKVGEAADATISGDTIPTPEIADTFRVCANTERFLRGDDGENENDERSGVSRPLPPAFTNFLQGAPMEISNCLKQQLGPNFKDALSSTTNVGPQVKERVQDCLNQFRPVRPSSTMMQRQPLLPHTSSSMPINKEQLERMMNQQNQNFKLDDRGNPMQQNPRGPEGEGSRAGQLLPNGQMIGQPILKSDGFEPNALELRKRTEQQLQQIRLQQNQNMQYQSMEGTMAPPTMINPPPLQPEPQTLSGHSPFGFLLQALFGY